MPIVLPPEIDTTGLVPRTGIGFDTASANAAFPPNAKTVLLVGQKLAAGAVPVLTLVDVLRRTQGEADFGSGSILDVAIKAAFRANPRVRLRAVSVADDGAGAAAIGNVTFAGGAATDAGSVETRIAGVTVRTAIAKNDAEAAIATRHAADINALAELPVTAAVNGGNPARVDLTARNKGTVANEIRLSSKMTRAIGTTATASGATLSGGATDPSFAAALAAVAGERHHEIVMLVPTSTPANEADDHVTLESDAEHNRGEICMVAQTGTLSTATTLSTALNSPRAMVWWCKDSESWSVRIAAAAAAVMAGETNAARPYNTLPLPGILAPPLASRPTYTELQNALAAGTSPLVVDASGDVAILRAVSTKTKNQAGNSDLSALDITVIQSFDRIREVLLALIAAHYSRSKWANDDPGGLLPPDVATPSKVKLDLLGAMRRLQEDEGIVQRVDDLAEDLLVERVGTQCHFSLPSDIVDGLHQVFGKVVRVQS